MEYPIKNIEMETEEGNDFGSPVYKCPVCGEMELRPVNIYSGDDQVVETESWICDEPDCQTEFIQRDNKLIPIS